MNNIRRKALDDVHSKLMEAVEELEGIAYDERDAFDNLPEGLQTSERGEQIEEYADTLECAKDTLDDIMGDLWDIIAPLYERR